VAVVQYESDGGTVWAAANNNNAVTVPLPATRPLGSVLLFVAWCRLISAAAPAPSGYTLLGTYTSGTASGGRIWVYAKEVVGGETDPSVTPAGVTGTSGDAWGACIYCYSGVNLSGGISAILDGTPTTTDASGTTTCTYPALTITNADSMLVRLLARFRDAADTFTPTATWNEREDASTTNRLGGQHHLQDKLATASGAQASVTVAPSNTTAARYLAVTLALKAALGTTHQFAATLVGDAAVAVDPGPVRNVASSLVGDAALAVDMVALPPPITFAIDLATNQPYAGEHTVGEFLAGTEPLIAVDLQIVSMEFIEGGISGQATVGASLSVERSLSVTVAQAGAVTAQQAVGRSVGAPITGTGAATAQQAVTRAVASTVIGAGAVSADTFVGHTISFGCTVAGQAAVTPALGRVYALASTVAGQGAISADIIRVPVTVSLGCEVAGAAAIAPSLTVTNANFISLDAAVAGQAAVAPNVTRSLVLAATVAGAGAVVAQEAPLRGLAASIAGQGAVTAQANATRAVAATVSRAAAIVAQQDPILATGGPVYFDATISRAASVAVTAGATRGLAATVSRFSTVGVDITRVGAVVDFACSLGLPLAGQKLAGTFLVGSGPGATVEAQMGPVVVSFVASINRAATVTAAAEWERTFAPSLITGQSAVSAQLLITRGLTASINRTATLDIDGRVIRLVRFECEIKVIPHIVGQYLAGEQVVGGTGPRASIEAYTVVRGPLGISIQGSASVESLLRPSTSLSSAIQGQAFITTESRPSLPFSATVGGQAHVAAYHVTSLVLGAALTGKAALKAKINLDWLVPTDPAGIILVPTDEESLILVPTSNGSVTLVPSVPGAVTLDPTDEEDVLLVPTTERTM
jgi:hypothetical protein